MSTSPRPRSIRVWPAIAIAAVAAVIAAVLVPMAAQAANVSLSGTVSSTSNVKLAGVPVALYNFGGTILGTQFASTTSSASGSFTFAAVPEGPYTLRFGASKTTYPQFLGATTDSTHAESLILNSGGGAHTYVSAVLASSGSIAGAVKTTTGVALHGYTVQAYPDGGDESTPVLTTTTSTTGAYTLAGLQPGNYRLEALFTGATPTYAPVFSGNVLTVEAATPVGVHAGAITPYSFSLGKSGTISGKVTGNGGEVLAGVKVIPYALVGTSPAFTDTSTEYAKDAITSSTGAYTLTGLQPGYYTLEFVPGTSPIGASHTVYGRTFLGAATTALAAPVIHIVSGSVITGKNIQLATGGSVTMQVVDGTQWEMPGNPELDLPNILVQLDHVGADPDQPGDAVETAITDAQGEVHFTGLGVGQYNFIIGSNVDSNPGDGITEDTTYQRVVATFPANITASNVGTPATEDFERSLAFKKDPAGLNPQFGAPSIATFGPSVPGAVVAVTAGGWNAPITSTSYQWLRDGQPISGATDQSYLLGAGDVGLTITAKVTVTSFAYGTASFTTDPLGAIGAGTLTVSGTNPFLQGTSTVGSTLTLYPGAFNAGGVVSHYQWQVSTDHSTWNDISGETGLTHVVTDSDLTSGPYLRVEWSAARAGYFGLTGDTPYDIAHSGGFTPTVAPKLTTTSSTWSFSSGTWIPNLGSTVVKWTVYPSNGSPAVQTIGSTLSRAGKTGEYVQAEIIRSAPGVIPDDYFVNIQTGKAPVAQSAAAVTGTPQFGSPLSATPPAFVPTVSTVNEQWQHRIGTVWKNITGATGGVYFPGVSDLGHALRVQETTQLAGYSPATIYTTATTPVVAAPAPAVNTAPSFVGTVGTNLTLTASPGTWFPLPNSFTYQWEYSSTGAAPFTKIAGATHATFTIPGSLLGKHIAVIVTPVLPGHLIVPTTLTIGTVSAANLLPTVAPKVSHVGTTYTASGAKFSPAASVTYHWYVYDTNDFTFTEQATGSAFNASAYPTSHIFVTARGHLSGYGDTDGAPVLAQRGTIQTTGGPITITGSKVGESLTASLLNYVPFAAITQSSVWQYKLGSVWKTIPGATATTYTPTSTYLGKQVRVAVTATHANYNSLTSFSTPVTITVGDAATPGAGANAPNLTGSNLVLAKQTVHPGTWSQTGETFTYQWETSPDNSTWTPVAGATASTFVIPESAFPSKYIGVRITALKAGHAAGVTTISNPSTASAGILTVVTAPKITKSGSTYTVSKGTWSTTPTVWHYDWQKYDPATDTVTFVGADLPSYTPVPADNGLPIAVIVIAERGPGPSGDAGGSATVVARLGNPIVPTAPLSVSGTATETDTVTANWSTWSVPGTVAHAQWYRGTKAIVGASNAAYQLQAADVGLVITAKVTVSRLGFPTTVYVAGSVTPVTDVDLTPSPNPVILGSGNVDEALSVAAFTLPTTGVTTKYQWFDSGEPIPGATAATYTPTAVEIGGEVSVELFFTKLHYASNATSVASVLVNSGVDLSTIGLVPLQITGTPSLSHPTALGSTSLVWNFAPTLSYQWQYQASGSPTWTSIPGANSITYTPNNADLGESPGDSIRLQITGIRPGHLQNTISSTPVVLQP